MPYGIEREIIIMKLLNHKNVMKLYDVWENDTDLFLIMEYIEGGELFDYLVSKGLLHEREAVEFFKQLISAVNYCHSFNICHRDLKPENILFDSNHQLKIADFGMAALENKNKLLETSCGSPHYAAPEIISGLNYHGKPTDIWSCGVILYALLSGKLPFDDQNISNLLKKVQSGNFEIPSFFSIEAKDLILKMLQINPLKRIKVDEILNHPLLLKYYPNLSKEYPISLYSQLNLNGILNKNLIDENILNNLLTL